MFAVNVGGTSGPAVGRPGRGIRSAEAGCEFAPAVSGSACSLGELDFASGSVAPVLATQAVGVILGERRRSLERVGHPQV
jgi:hypothetical protein